LQSNWPYFRESHPFPGWKRWEFPTLDSFLDALHIDVTWNTGANLVTFDVKAHGYEIRRPIVEPNTRVLLANFYPSGRTGQVVENLSIFDSRLFTIV